MLKTVGDCLCLLVAACTYDVARPTSSTPSQRFGVNVDAQTVACSPSCHHE